MLQFGIPGGPELLIILLILLLFVAVPLVVIAGAVVYLVHRRRTRKDGTNEARPSEAAGSDTDAAEPADADEPPIRARNVDTDSSSRDTRET